MPEDVASVPFADRSKVFRCTPEHGLQIGPFRPKFRQDNTAVPGIVRNQRTNIEVAIISAAIVHDFDGSAYAADMRRDHFSGTRRATDRDVRLDANGDFKFQPQPPEIRAPDGRSRLID